MAKKRVQKIRFAINLSTSDISFKKLYDELAAIDDAHEESAVTTLKRDLMLRILHDYCNPKTMTTPARTEIVRQSVHQDLPALEAQTQVGPEMQAMEVRVVSMTMGSATAEQTKSIDDIFNESMKSFVDFD
jgi:hypothetical protein